MSAEVIARCMRLALAETALERGNAFEVEFWLRRATEGDRKPEVIAQRAPRVEGIYDAELAFETLERLLDHADCRPHVSPTGQGSALCPAHDDRGASLRFKEDGRLLINCRAGCPVDEVLAALGTTWRALGGLR